MLRSLGRQQAAALRLDKLRLFSRYRRHPGLSRAERARLVEGEARGFLAGADLVVVSDSDGLPDAVFAVRFSHWDSEHFGMPMANAVFMAADELTDEVLTAIVRHALALTKRELGCRHISIECDIDDYPTFHALTSAGFQVVDIKRIYSTHRIQPHAGYERFLQRVRPFHPGDEEAVRRILDQVGFGSRFTRDCCLACEKSSEVYRQWLGKLIDGWRAGQSHLLVYESGGKVAAFGGIGEQDLGAWGVSRKLRAGSLFAACPSATGAYGPVIYRMTRDALRTHGLVEAAISLNNASAARVIEGIRPNRSVTRYCLRYCDA